MTEIASDGWEGVPRDRLIGRWGVPDLRTFETVGSTNDLARRLAAGGAVPGTLVVADAQTTGRGRVGRPWDSPRGLGLWLSMIAPAPTGAASAGSLPLRVGVAIARALDPVLAAGLVGIKWPNDLVIGGRKMGGILCEGAWEGRVAGPVVVGVGLNVLQTEAELPPAVRGSAVSLSMAAGRPITRLGVADAVVPALLAALMETSPPRRDLEEQLERRDVLRGGPVAVTEPASGAPLLSGMAMGIAPDGGLLVRDPRGVLRTVSSGTVRLSGPRGGAEPAGAAPGEGGRT